MQPTYQLQHVGHHKAVGTMRNIIPVLCATSYSHVSDIRPALVGNTNQQATSHQQHGGRHKAVRIVRAQAVETCGDGRLVTARLATTHM